MPIRVSLLLGVIALALGGCGDDASPAGDGGGGADGRQGADGPPGGPDGASSTDGDPGADGAGPADGGGAGPDAAGCVGAAVPIGDGAAGTCAFEMPISFEAGRINVVVSTPGGNTAVCHTLRETGCAGEGWYWTYDHRIALCDASCATLMGGGAAAQVVVETGCPGLSCGSAGCTSSSGYCTHATAYTCCSGRCDGDSCGSGLWGPCTTAFGCFEGTCQSGYCRCPPGDLQCGANCVDRLTDPQNCGTCGRVCTGGMTCQAGDCRCPAGQQDCGGTCVSVTDPSHCGMCGVTCRPDQICTGSCQCPFPLSDCGGACVDTRFDLNHCGGCGVVCDPVSETCSPGGIGSSYYCVCRSGFFDCGGDGVCEDLQTDEAHCGFCGNDCPGMQQCTGGNCG